MNIFKKLLPAVLVFTAFTVHAQTADEIIAKNIEAMGGAAKLSTLNTVKYTGSINAQGGDFDLIITKSYMKGMRMDLDVMGTSYYQFATADKGVRFMPGMAEAADMDAETLKTFFSQTDIQGVLFNYKEKGTIVEYLGKEKGDSGDVYKLKLSFKDGRKANCFIDVKSNRVVKSTATVNYDGQEIETVTSLADYRTNADGYWFAYSVTTQNGVITYSKIESNIKVDDSIYQK